MTTLNTINCLASIASAIFMGKPLHAEQPNWKGYDPM